MAGHLSVRSAQLAGVRLAYTVSAQREASLVLLHGGSGTRVGAGLIDHIDGRWQCWAPDLRGHGDSSHTPGHYALDEVASDIALLIKEVVGSPSAVYGHSFGGHVSLALAAGWPDLVRGLILGDTPLSLETLAPHIDRNRGMTSKWRELAASGAPAAEVAERDQSFPWPFPEGLMRTILLDRAPLSSGPALRPRLQDDNRRLGRPQGGICVDIVAVAAVIANLCP